MEGKVGKGYSQAGVNRAGRDSDLENHQRDQL